MFIYMTQMIHSFIVRPPQNSPQDALEQQGVQTRLMSAIRMEAIAEPFIRRRAVRHLEKGRVVIFGAGTGNPYFTTDTAGALRAIEIEADVILKGTRVDGIYDSDPEKNDDAKKYDRITGDDVLKQRLSVMDLTAFTLCRENNTPIIVFNMNERGNFKKIVVDGEDEGTTVYNLEVDGTHTYYAEGILVHNKYL